MSEAHGCVLSKFLNYDEYWRTCYIGQTLLVEWQGLGADVASQAACGECAAFLTLEPGLSSQARPS